MNASRYTRRRWFEAVAFSTWAAVSAPALAASPRSRRSFHVCLAPDVLERNPDLLPTVRTAGVETVWIAGYFYGHEVFSPQRLKRTRQQVEQAGLQAHLVNVPLGHPGDSLGAEKAGIRLPDYRRVPFRVGELMFQDAAFRPAKGKTDELFSALFHRRFTTPENAYSETTAFPASQLSALHLVGKLAVSTLADVRHTLFMSGLTPFPMNRWDVLAPAMRRAARLHGEVAGARPHGPFKHFWGKAQRRVGDDQPFSLWLAVGVPFEVVDEPSREGWTFLSDYDARQLTSSGRWQDCRLVCRTSAATHPDNARLLSESLPELFAFKRQLRAQLRDAPCVEEDVPAVCAWYPKLQRVVVWNLADQPVRLTVVYRDRRCPLDLPALEAGSAIVAPR